MSLPGDTIKNETLKNHKKLRCYRSPNFPFVYLYIKDQIDFKRWSLFFFKEGVDEVMA